MVSVWVLDKLARGWQLHLALPAPPQASSVAKAALHGFPALGLSQLTEGSRTHQKGSSDRPGSQLLAQPELHRLWQVWL